MIEKGRRKKEGPEWWAWLVPESSSSKSLRRNSAWFEAPSGLTPPGGFMKTVRHSSGTGHTLRGNHRRSNEFSTMGAS